VIAIPLVVIMGGIIRETAERQIIQQVLEAQIASQGGELSDFEYRADRSGVVVVATMRLAHPLSQTTVDATATALSGQLGHPVTLEVVALPAIRSAPPPTP
jgi:hypothetical protein